MGVLTPKRVVLFIVAVLLGTSAFAKQPSPRSLARMAWNAASHQAVLFGGRGVLDQATGVLHASDETWIWNGGKWVQQFPLTTPPARAAHTMVYDSARGRIVMFGGRQEPASLNAPAVYLNDTWAWKHGNWTRIESEQNPTPRHFNGMAYDSDRDRILLYGGLEYAADGKNSQNDYETWEFDGVQWTLLDTDSVKVIKPLLAYDAAAKQTVMVGLSDTGTARVMYRWDATAKAWVQFPSSTTMPTCVNEGHLIYQEHRGRLLFFGGVCPTGTPGGEEVFEWDGSAWTKLTSNAVARGLGQAVAYDPLRDQIYSYGGMPVTNTVPASGVVILRNAQWLVPVATRHKPSPRSLTTFVSDPVNNTIWMFGGLDEDSAFYHGDFWSFRNGQWSLMPESDKAPGGGCESPLAARDTDRNVLVVVCGGIETYEFNGAEWKALDPAKDPPARYYGSMVYDQKLKKTIIFGGYFGNNYRNDTWAWDGTNWAELKVDSDKRPPHRGLAAMWYDPLQQKTIVYGGLGRGSVNEKISRYDDMWSFDGTRWTKMSVSNGPGVRFGPQYAINPTTGKLLLFGGLRAENIDEDSLRQYFANDTWEWDGASSRWTRLEPTRVPDVRENGGMAWDPVTGRMTMFAGYADGFYRSDVWTWTGQDWEPDLEGETTRRRAVR